ncbi:MAG: anaerobic ribonucleoside-triphosphate reductase [Alphaproteobacteria bacterium]|nr:anaerobic ribonucleoside-triphosphate reductase [Alphaproteobacteria bacterium]
MMNNNQRTKCEIFSRSMGYIRPVSNFNIGKYSEFCERKTFTEENSLTTGERHCDLLKKVA